MTDVDDRDDWDLSDLLEPVEPPAGGAAQVRRRARRRVRARLVAASALVVAVVATTVTLVVPGSGLSHPQQVMVGGSPIAAGNGPRIRASRRVPRRRVKPSIGASRPRVKTSHATPKPTYPVSPGYVKGAEPAGFGVTGVSFLTANQGWAVGSTGCTGCAGVATTHDGGQTWSYLPTPPADLYWYDERNPSSISDIDFANTSDGYLFAPGLYATHDGGKTWTDSGLTSINSLTVAGGYAYALTGFPTQEKRRPTLLYRSRLGSNRWQKVALPSGADNTQFFVFKTAAAGSDLLLLQSGIYGEAGRLWESADAGKTWQPLTVPCSSSDGSPTVLGVALGHPHAWLLLCFRSIGVTSDQQTVQHLYGTTDGGHTWVRLGNPPQSDDPESLADNGAGHAFVADEGAADVIFRTLDGSQDWGVSISDAQGSFYGWGDLEFVSSDVGFVVGPTHYAPTHLYRTVDGGKTWTPLAISLPVTVPLSPTTVSGSISHLHQEKR